MRRFLSRPALLDVTCKPACLLACLALALLVLAPLAQAPPAHAREALTEQPMLTAHVMVLLCDNEHQGIAPVPAALGDGLDPDSNLYWGALYGLRTVFTKSDHWRLLSCGAGTVDGVLERCIFEHAEKNAVVVADAWAGDRALDFLDAFLQAVSGQKESSLRLPDGRMAGQVVGIMGSADLVAYVGHNVLMDRVLAPPSQSADERMRQAVILACASKDWFGPLLELAGANPLLWTTGFLAPEGYVLEGALDGWARADTAMDIAKRAARAYASHQHCSVASAMKLFVTGW